MAIEGIRIRFSQELPEYQSSENSGNWHFYQKDEEGKRKETELTIAPGLGVLVYYRSADHERLLETAERVLNELGQKYSRHECDDIAPPSDGLNYTKLKLEKMRKWQSTQKVQEEKGSFWISLRRKVTSATE